MLRVVEQLEKQLFFLITFKAAQQLGKKSPVKTLNIYSHSVAGKATYYKIDLTSQWLEKTSPHIHRAAVFYTAIYGYLDTDKAINR